MWHRRGFPESHWLFFSRDAFFLIDIGKKIKVVQAVAEALELKNVKAEQLRAIP
jgi:16S rRNA (guanine527-N7)-methyltransferase